MPDVDIQYNGASIATMNASGTKTLLTKNLVCTDDIKVVYNGGGSASAPYNDVNFFDYDGTILYSYSAADFANLSAMPANPTHTGLTAQGWNWTLNDAKAQVLISGCLDIGQQYKTSDGKTRLYVRITYDALLLRLYLSQSVGRNTTIDWGDGSATETVSGTGNRSANHSYSAIGDYVITLTVTSGTMMLGGTSTSASVIVANTNGAINANRTALYRVEIGDYCTPNKYAFYSQFGIESIVAPPMVSSNYFGAPYSCRSALYLMIPSGVTNLYARGSSGMKYISLPKSFTTIDNNAFNGDANLFRVVIPSGVTTIPTGAFKSCTALSKIVIPPGVTSIGASAFDSCSSMREYHFKSTTPPTLTDATVFANIPSQCKIYVPSARLATYQSANVWSGFASYMVGE